MVARFGALEALRVVEVAPPSVAAAAAHADIEARNVVGKLLLVP
ncbi:hypothetical protein GCM10022220_23020 [Actinocatenispora rupis]|uniref:Zinc-binding dehydrogenase n=1 Tax=Actinocatenispora rupis TaxID=519421 RepID=A0A8J3J4J2_9ACTN|nr:hypothetical protein Aru02nite_27260 [Actinocatenispora rupis]